MRSFRHHWPIVLALLVLLVVGGVIGWHKLVRDRIYPRRLGVVTPALIYRSGQIDQGLIESTLRDRHIHTIVDLTGYEADDADNLAEVAAAERLGIEHIRLPMKGDGVGSVERYAQAVAQLDHAARSGQPVLVHCSAGTQRTGGVVASYRLLVQHQDPQTVLVEMQRYDWDPQEDHTLSHFLNENLPAIADALVERGVIDHAPDPMPRLD